MVRQAIGVLCALFVTAAANAAFIVEVDIDGLDDGVLTFSPNFSFGGDTTAASESIASSAFGMTGGDSIFGGNGSVQTHEYVFTYDPGTEADNLGIPKGQDLGNGNFGTGVAGGDPGRYTVYATWPTTVGVSGGNTTWDVTTAGDFSSVALDQNNLGDSWIKVGEIDWSSGPITVQQKAGANTFVSMRSAGMMFEAVPEPATMSLLGLAGLAFLRRRRQTHSR